MWIMVSGPYTSGALNDQERQSNLDELNRAALIILERGHIPIVGVNIALPIIAVAGADRFDEIMMPVSLAVAERCDACVRIGGASIGADAEVERLRSAGKPVYLSVGEIPAETVS